MAGIVAQLQRVDYRRDRMGAQKQCFIGVTARERIA
jgi:hypothetical protein